MFCKVLIFRRKESGTVRGCPGFRCASGIALYLGAPVLQLFTIVCDGLTHRALRVFIVSLGSEVSELVGEA